MTALHPETSANPDTTTKNPYNTRRKSLYFSPTTHSAGFVESPTTPTTIPTSTKHPVQHPEPNPRSPKRLKRLVHVDRSFTPPPSPPNNHHLPPSTVPIPPATVADIGSLDYDEEDDPVINAIIHVLQLSDNTPLSTRDLSSSILEFRLCSLDSPNPSSVVSSRITSHLKRRAAEKPPREPLLIRYESENGRKRTEYHMKHPDLVSDRSPLYEAIKAEQRETKVLQAVPASKLNIISSDVLDILDSDDYDSEDISNRSPDRPTLFDPPSGVTISPHHQTTFDDLLGNTMMADIDVPTGIKLDYEFFEPTTVSIDTLTPSSEEISYPNTPLQEVFSRRASPIDPPDEESTPPAEDEPDDPQSPHSGAPNGNNTLPTSFYDSPLIYHSMALSRTQTEEVEMFESNVEEEEDEVRVVEMRTEPHISKQPGIWSEDFTWEEKREGHVPSPEKVGMDELEEWLEGI
jgi:hypothetical protein